MKDFLIVICVVGILIFGIIQINNSVNKRYQNYSISPNSNLFDDILSIKSTNLPKSNQAIKDRLTDKKITRKEYDEIVSIYNRERSEEIIRRLIND